MTTAPFVLGRGRAGRIEELHDLHDGTARQHDFQEVELLEGAFGVQRQHGRLDALDDDVLGAGPTLAKLPGLGKRHRAIPFEDGRNETAHVQITHRMASLGTPSSGLIAQSCGFIGVRTANQGGTSRQGGRAGREDRS